MIQTDPRDQRSFGGSQFTILKRSSFALWLTIAAMLLSETEAFSAEASWTGLGQNTLWSDARNWSSDPAFPNNFGDTTYDVTIQAQTNINLDRDVVIDRLSYSSPVGKLIGDGSLVVTESFRAERFQFSNRLIESFGEGSITDAYPSFTTTRFINRGHLIFDVAQIFTGYSGLPGTFVNETGGVVEFHTGFQLGFQAAFNPVPLENLGTWIHQAESTRAELPFNNDGRLLIETGSLILAAGRNTGEIHVETGASVVMRNYFSIGDNASYTGTGTIEIGERYQLPASIGENYQFDGLTRITGQIPVEGPARLGSRLEIASTLTIRSHASARDVFISSGGLRIESGGVFDAQSVSIQSGGGLTLDGGVLNSTNGVVGVNGSISGIGQIAAATHLGGVDFLGRPYSRISPGTAIGYPGTGLGRLEFSDNLTLDNVNLEIMLGGTQRGFDYDSIDVAATLTSLKSVLALSVATSFLSQISSTDEFEILRANQGLIGTISNALNGARISTVNGRASFLVSYRPLSGGGTSVVLSDYLPVPEVDTALLIGVGLAILAGGRIHRV